MQRLNNIRELQQLGFSLDEIGMLYEDDSHAPTIGQLSRKIRDTEQQLRMLIDRREKLLNWRRFLKEIRTMEKFSIHSLPEIIVASHREVIPSYEAIGEMCCNVIGPEMQRLGCKCPPPGYCFTVEHNKEYTPTDIDIEYCEQVEEMGAGLCYRAVQEVTSRARGLVYEALRPIRPLLRVLHRTV
ncbi:MAG: MerR family DNA-binding protein [Prevotella sp.]